MESVDGFKCVKCGRENMEVAWRSFMLMGIVSLCIDCYLSLGSPVAVHDIIRENYEWLKNIVPYS